MKIFEDVLVIWCLVCLLAWGELPDDASEAVDVVAHKSIKEEFSRYNKEVAKDHPARERSRPFFRVM